MGMNPNQIAVTLVILCKTQALLFDGDEPQFRLQLHWWCYCVFGAGGAFEGEEMYTQHVLRAPLQCIGGRWCVIQRSIGLPLYVYVCTL